MATIDWPTGRAYTPADLTIGISAPGATWTAPYGGPTQRVSLLNDKLTARFSLPPLIDKSAAGQREALLFGIKSAGDIVRLHHWARPYPNGNFMPPACTVTSSVLAGARSIALSNCFGVNRLKNPGFEVDSDSNGLSDGLSSYSSGTTGSITFGRQATAFTGRTGMMQTVTASALGTTSGDRAGFRFGLATVAAGQTVTLSAYVDATTGCSVYIAAAFLQVDGSTYISEINDTWVAGGASGRRSCTGVAPAGTAFAQVFVAIQQAPSAGVSRVLYVDDVQLEIAAAASTFQGNATLIGGDMLGVGGKLLQVAYAGSTADANAQMVVPLSLATRAAISSGAAVTWAKPTSTWEILGIDPQLEYRGGGLQLGPEITLVEA